MSNPTTAEYAMGDALLDAIRAKADDDEMSAALLAIPAFKARPGRCRGVRSVNDGLRDPVLRRPLPGDTATDRCAAVVQAGGAVVNLRRFFHRRSTVPTTREPAGADVKFVGELKAMREAPVDPNLVSDVEADLTWAQELHHFERSMLDEIDRVFAPILVAAAEFASFEDLREELMPA